MKKPLKITLIFVGSIILVCIILGIVVDGDKDKVAPKPESTDIVVVSPNVTPTPTTSITGETPTFRSSAPKTTHSTVSVPKPSKPKVTAKPKPIPLPPPSVYYANCDAVRSAGKAPLHRGDPGYRSGLDRDGDGVACE